MTNALMIEKEDNVIVVIEAVKKGDTVTFQKDGEHSLTAADDIPIYHKMACRFIAKGEPIVKYAQHIGVAACDIKTGEHVHTHNVESKREVLEERESAQ